MVGIQKCISKSELAGMLGIHRNTLMKWIKKNPVLLGELKNAGYNKMQKLFTPGQIVVILKTFSN